MNVIVELAKEPLIRIVWLIIVLLCLSIIFYFRTKTVFNIKKELI